MIVITDNIGIIKKAIDNAIIIEGISRETLLQMVMDSIGANNRFIITDVEDGDIAGFMFATIEWFDGSNVAFIQACYSKKDGNVQVMLDKCMDWARGLGLSRIIFMSKRNPEAWNRKYKFDNLYTVMGRNL